LFFLLLFLFLSSLFLRIAFDALALDI
jgi:hypothetical protein